MIRDILKMGDARLLRMAQAVTVFDTPEIHDLLQDMRDTMAHANGAGLAAPQIGVNLQVVIFGSGQINPRYPDAPPVPPTVLLNPQITPLSAAGEVLRLNMPIAAVDTTKFATNNGAESLRYLAQAEDLQSDWEGCLSVPGLRGQVTRYRRIRYQGFDECGQVIDRIAEGFHARVVQHECDHLWGILYPMRVKDFSQFGYTSVLFPGLDTAADD